MVSHSLQLWVDKDVKKKLTHCTPRLQWTTTDPRVLVIVSISGHDCEHRKSDGMLYIFRWLVLRSNLHLVGNIPNPPRLGYVFLFLLFLAGGSSFTGGSGLGRFWHPKAIMSSAISSSSS